MEKEKHVFVGVKMPEKLRNEFNELAQKTGRKMAGYIRYLVQQEVEKNK